MRCGMRVALGVAGGYLLGRTKKLRLALMFGGMVAGRRIGGPRELLAQGAELLSRSPEVARLSEDVRSRLLDAGKRAAVAAATRQVESLTDRVSERIGALGDHHAANTDGSGGAEADREPDGQATNEERPRSRPSRSSQGAPRGRSGSDSRSGPRKVAKTGAERSGHPTHREAP